MAVLRPLDDEEACDDAREIFADIRKTRGTDFINNFWRMLAHDPDEMRRVWNELKTVMAPGALDPLTKEMIYIAVSAANGCSYCVHSHTAAARAKGMTPEQHAELVSVIGMAGRTNHLVNALQVETDAAFDVTANR